MCVPPQLAGCPVSHRGPPQILRGSGARRLHRGLTHTCLSSHCNFTRVHNFVGHVANRMLGLDLADVLYIRHGQRKIFKPGFPHLLLILFSFTWSSPRFAEPHAERTTQTFKPHLKALHYRGNLQFPPSSQHTFIFLYREQSLD